MKLFGICCSLPLLLAAASCGSNSPAESYPAHVDADFTAVYSPDKGGVTGSDGTISILLDDGTSLFMTGDCFLGEVVDGKRDPSLQMINNSLIHIAADGSYDGFDLAMAEELCSRLGWDFEAVPIVWDSKDAELAAGTINCIWNGFTYTGRENDYTWSDPYVDNSIVMVVKADSGISSLADLTGKSVMAQAASSAVDAINANESLKSSLKEVVELADYNTGFMELKQGSVDAIAADLGVAKFQIASNEGDYVILDEPISTEQYAIGFLKGNTELRDAVNAELLKMAEDGTMLSIAEKYVDQGLVIDSLCLVK